MPESHYLLSDGLYHCVCGQKFTEWDAWIAHLKETDNG